MVKPLQITRLLVGILFIFSGLVKANDPLGLSYKMKEFFELWNAGLEQGNFFLKNLLINFFQFWHQHSLSLSIVMIALEIVAGVALLVGWKPRLVSWFMLVLILFFTFLTGYAYLSGKFTNCGCFGDCIPISPKTSFIKDIVLTHLIIYLFINRHRIQPIYLPKINLYLLMATTAFSFIVQWWVLNYLPFFDCLPFKKGNNISAQMKPRPGSAPDSFAIRFIYEKDGKQFEFSPNNLPSDLNNYIFKDRIDKLVRKGNADPPIKGFVLKDSAGQDVTNAVLQQPACLVLFCDQFSIPVKKWEEKFLKVLAAAHKKNIPVYLVVSSATEAEKALAGSRLTSVPVFECDFTAIRTAARTNPCLYLLKNGTVADKWSWRKMENAVNKL